MTRGRRHTYSIAAIWTTTLCLFVPWSRAVHRSAIRRQPPPQTGPHSQETLDHSSPVKGMYRLLDLTTEQGSNGLGNHLSLDYQFLRT